MKNTSAYVRMDAYLDTWSGFEAAKTAPWPSVGDSTTLVNSLSPQMSEVVGY